MTLVVGCHCRYTKLKKWKISGDLLGVLVKYQITNDP